VESDDGEWSLDYAFLEEALQPDTRAVIVNSPHNPTGFCMDAAALQRLVEFCRRHKLLLFCDEVYRYVSWQTVGPLSTVLTT